MELLKLYAALLRRRWLVLEAIVFFTAAGGALAMLLPKNYEASARVLVNSSDTAMSILSDLGLSEVAAGLSNASDDITNKISLATTRPVLDEVIWRLQLRDDDGKLYTAEQLLVPGLTGELEARPGISITQQQGTDILVFQARADDPELARLLADTLVKVAVQQSQKRARADTASARKFIEQQLGVVREEFDQAMAQIADAKARDEVLDIDAEMKAAIARLSELMLAYEENAAAIEETRARLAEARAYQRKETGGAVSPETLATNAKVADIQARLTDLKADRAKQLTDKTEKHPDIARIDEMIAATEAELQAAIEEQHALDPGVAELEAKLAGLVKKGKEIDAGIQRTTKQFSAYPEKLREFSQLELAAGAAEEVYKALQEQRYQVGVAEAMLVSDLQLVEPAKAPDKHSSPRLLVNLVLGFGLGVGSGVGLAFLFEYVDDSVKGPEELTEAWPAPRLGVVPRFKAEGDRRVIDRLPNTHPVVEAYRTIRNGLLFASLDKPLELVAVTSALPGEGKSTFSVNLAVSFAREGKRVLLVDCDLRRPTQHRNFPTTSNHRGLTDVLARKATVEEAVQATGVEGLSLLSSGPTPGDPARLVESLRLRQLLIDLRKSWDVVVVDTPPALVVADALIIGRAADGVVVVVESGSTSRKLLADLRGRFQTSGLEPIGLVLNKLDFFTSGYGHYARAYQKYHHDTGGDAPNTHSGGAA